MNKHFVRIISTLLSVLLVLSAFAPLAGAEDLLSSGEQITYKGHTYIRVDASMTWHEAKAYCEKNGGYLATLTDFAEKTAVERLILNGSKELYWLGATDEETEGEWKWVTGEEWTGLISESDFDNTAGNEHYLQMRRVSRSYSGNGLGTLNDSANDAYSAKYPEFYSLPHVGFVYEKGAYEKAPSGEDEYTVNGLTAEYNGHTYTLVEEALTWKEAKAACEQQGGYLATVTSEKENEVIKALIANGTKKDMYWLGGTDEAKEGEWKWITGEEWDYVSENHNFDNARDNENYLQIQRTTYRNKIPVGYWNDANNNNTAKETDFYYPENVGYILEIGEIPYISNGLTVTYGSHTYTLIEESLTWEQAEKACEKQGGYLATVTSQEENEVINLLIRKGTQKSVYWLGGTDKYHEGDWQWVTGEDWCYVPQNLNFDNANGGEDYLQVQRKTYKNKRKLGYWNDICVNNTARQEETDFYYPENVGYILEIGNDFITPETKTSVEDAPIIYVKGRTGIMNANGNYLRVENTEDIPDIILDLKDELLDAVKTDDWDTYQTALTQKLEEKFGDYSLNNDGEIDNGSHNAFTWSYQSVPTVQQDIFSYLFEYDGRRDPWAIAEDLHAFISCVKAKTGSSKIHFVSRCLGCNVVSAYLARYGYEDVLSNVFFASAAKGFDYESEMFAGKFAADSEALARYSEQSFEMDDVYVTEFLRATVQLCNDMGILDPATDVGIALFNKIKDKIMPTLLLNTFATCPGYWSMINDDNFEAAKQFIFGDEMYTTYKNLVAKIDRYHYTVMNRLENTLVNMKNSGINMYVICKYGFQCSPLIESSNNMSDDTVDLYSQSFGATCANMGETLSKKYLRNADKNGTSVYISPDKQIDSSTALFKDSTWYIKNLKHSPFYDCFNLLMQEMCYSEEQFTVFDDSSYPQYLFYNTDNSTCVPLDDNNKTYNDFEDKGFFQYVINYFKSLYALLKNLFGQKETV